MKQQNVIYALGAFKSTCTMILTPFFDQRLSFLHAS